MTTYSFIDVTAVLTGPGGTIPLGYGAALSKEGITIDRTNDKDKLDIGADGTPMHTLRADRSGTVLVRLQKTSPTNSLLQTMYDFQTLSSANWGQNVITISNNVLGDLIVCSAAAFRKMPSVSYAEDANMLEWGFNVGVITAILGP